MSHSTYKWATDILEEAAPVQLVNRASWFLSDVEAKTGKPAHLQQLPRQTEIDCLSERQLHEVIAQCEQILHS